MNNGPSNNLIQVNWLRCFDLIMYNGSYVEMKAKIDRSFTNENKFRNIDA